jgi:hypothetical protein
LGPAPLREGGAPPFPDGAPLAAVEPPPVDGALPPLPVAGPPPDDVRPPVPMFVPPVPFGLLVPPEPLPAHPVVHSSGGLEAFSLLHAESPAIAPSKSTDA